MLGQAVQVLHARKAEVHGDGFRAPGLGVCVGLERLLPQPWSIPLLHHVDEAVRMLGGAMFGVLGLSPPSERRLCSMQAMEWRGCLVASAGVLLLHAVPRGASLLTHVASPASGDGAPSQRAAAR